MNAIFTINAFVACKVHRVDIVVSLTYTTHTQTHKHAETSTYARTLLFSKQKPNKHRKSKFNSIYGASS